jgi:MFS family permease
MLVFTMVYIAGIFGQTFANGSLSAMYASRFISGIGIGTTTVLPSIYITEVCPHPNTSCTHLNVQKPLTHMNRSLHEA